MLFSQRMIRIFTVDLLKLTATTFYDTLTSIDQDTADELKEKYDQAGIIWQCGICSMVLSEERSGGYITCYSCSRLFHLNCLSDKVSEVYTCEVCK